MKTQTDLSDLLASVEAAREELHADLDSELLRKVVQAEQEAGEEDAKALKGIRKLFDAAVEAAAPLEGD